MHPANEGALAVQHGGDHYKNSAIQPIQFGHANYYDPEVFSTMKYVSRHTQKHGRLDLEKAGHFVDLRVQMIGIYGKPRPALDVIPVEEYIRANIIPVQEAEILRTLHEWALQTRSVTDEAVADILKRQITELADLHYRKDQHDSP